MFVPLQRVKSKNEKINIHKDINKLQILLFTGQCAGSCKVIIKGVTSSSDEPLTFVKSPDNSNINDRIENPNGLSQWRNGVESVS